MNDNPVLLIDLNSILSAAMLVGKDPDGYTVDGVNIPTFDYGYSNWIQTFRRTLDVLDIKPKDVIGVVDAQGSRKARQKIWPDYKEHREKRPDEYYKEFNELTATAKTFIKQLGGSILSVKETEADDVLAHIAPKIPGCTVWTKDKDLLHIDANIFLSGEFIPKDEPSCGDRFNGILRRHIPLYRTFVGDPGDFKGMGAIGFGAKKFLDMWVFYGDEGLDEIMGVCEDMNLESLEDDLADFPAFKYVLADVRTVKKTWRLAQWVKFPDYKLDWDTGMVCGKDCETFDIDFEEFYGVQTLVTKDNFKNLEQVIKQQAAECDFVSLDIETDVDEESWEWVKNIKLNIRKDAMSIDVHGSKLCGLSVTIGDNMQHTYYFSIDHADTRNLESETVRKLIMTIVEDEDVIVHNAAGFELPVLFNNWGQWLPNVKDNVIAASYVDENSAQHLKGLSMAWLKYKQQTYQEVLGDRNGMREVTGKEVLSYGCDDTIATAALYQQFRYVMLIEDTWEVFLEVESDSQYMCAHSFVNGIKADLEKLEELKTKDEGLYDEAYKTIERYLIKMEWPGSKFIPLSEFSASEIKRAYEIIEGEPLATKFRKIEKLAALCGTEEDELGWYILNGNLDGLNRELAEIYEPKIDLKVNSAKMITELLYNYMKVDVLYRNAVTDTQKAAGQNEGNPSSDEAAVKWAIIDKKITEEEKEVLEAVLTCRSVKTRNGLYYNSYKHLVHWQTGNLHPQLKQSKTSSRRFAPSGPNVNQIPKRSEEGKKVREAIVPHDIDCVIVAPDFSGQELRLAAEDSQDAAFLSCYIGDDLKDLHTITGHAICMKRGKEFPDYSDFEKAVANGGKTAVGYRNDGKQTNFLSQYGGTSYTLSKKLVVPEDVAQLFLDAKDMAFPGVKIWSEELSKKCKRDKYATTFLGAKKHIHALLHTSDESHVLRSSCNFRIQSSAAEQTKLVMGRVWRSGILVKYSVRFYMPVHDELVFSVPKIHLNNFCYELRPMMEAPYAHMKVPIVSSLDVGPNFGELKEMEWPTELLMDDIPY